MKVADKVDGTPTFSDISLAEFRFLTDGILQDCRSDGRRRAAYRPLSVETGIFPSAAGSSRVRNLENDLLVGVKLDLRKCDSADAGRIFVSVDCSSSVSIEAHESRGGEDFGFFLATQVREFCLNALAVPLELLDVEPRGFFRWTVFVDVVVLNSGGNVLDCVALGVVAALRDTRLPKIDVVADPRESEHAEDPAITFEVDERPEAGEPFPADQLPLLVSVGRVGGHSVWDMGEEEELCATGKLTLAVDPSGRCVGLHKDGQSTLELSTLASIMEASEKAGTHLHEQLRKAVTASAV
eukprot:Polyplicarium_translucidae@DN662_c0_g1_i1.p1